MELIITIFQAGRILGVVNDKSIQDKIRKALILAQRQKIDLTRVELMLIMYSLLPVGPNDELITKLTRAIDRATSISCGERVRIVGGRGQMPKNTIGVVTSIIEADIDHRNFLVEFEHTDYWRNYLAYEIEPE